MIYGLGMQELLVILAIVMLLFGGKKLPEVGRNLGQAIRGFRESEEETRKELQESVEGKETGGAKDDPSAPRQDPEQTGPGQEGEARGAQSADDTSEAAEEEGEKEKES